MALTFPTKLVTLTGLGSGYVVELLELSIGHGDRWGYAVLRLPKELAIDMTTMLGNLFTISITPTGGASTVLFQGWMAELPSTIEPQSELVQITLFDVRWLLARRKVGCHGVGNGGYESAGVGGFPIVGYRVHFNPDGKPNRSQNPVDSGNPDVYGFDVTESAQPWSLRDALYFLLNWYAPELKAPAHESPLISGTNWDKEITNWQPYGKPVGRAITELCADAGESWAIGWVSGDSGVTVPWLSISHTPVTTVTFRLPDTAGEPASASTELQIVRMNATPRITDSCDVVEVHSNRMLVETTVASLLAPDDDVSKVLNYTPETYPGYVVGLQIDPTKYADAKLGKNLPAGSRNKPWRSRLLTLAKPDTHTYYDAFATGDFLSAKKLDARTINATECIWCKVGSADTWHRVHEGALILWEEGKILLGDLALEGWIFGKGWGASMIETPASQLFIKITLVIEIEDQYIFTAQDDSTAWLINQTASPGKKLVDMVIRSDLHPLLRYQSHLPQLDTTKDPDAYTVAEPASDDPSTDEAVDYLDVTGELEKIANRHLAALASRENEVQIELLDVPLVNLGAGIAVAPGSVNLVGNEVVVGLRYNFQQGDHVTVIGTNNLARLMVDDL
jgi:hypothetical protein